VVAEAAKPENVTFLVTAQVTRLGDVEDVRRADDWRFDCNFSRVESRKGAVSPPQRRQAVSLRRVGPGNFTPSRSQNRT
jgi:hypothetical protein